MILETDIAAIASEAPIQPTPWQMQDTIWMLSLYGTAIGAGILFLPINAGLHGIWPIVIMLLLAFPMTYLPHRALCRFVLSSSSTGNITDVVEEHFGVYAGRLLTLLYFFAIYPILLLYSVAITNTTESFLVNQMGMTPLPRSLLAIILVAGLMTVVRFGQDVIVKSMSILVYPFVCTLILMGIYLIPHWNNAILQQSNSITSEAGSGLLMAIWLLIPVMVFSFNHSPIISSFAVTQKKRYGKQADEKSNLILKYSHIMMVVTVMFFVLSCTFSLSPKDFALAKAENVSILSYLANHFQSPIFTYVAPIVAFVAITKSFFGHYLGAREGCHGLIIKFLPAQSGKISENTQSRLVEIFIILTCWLAATLNPSILGTIETLSGPVIAMLLFLMPAYAIAKVPSLQKYRHPTLSNAFVTVIGLIAISAIFYRLII